MKKLTLFLSVIILTTSACLKERLRANGDRQTETRTLSQFSGVETSGSKHIHVTYGTEYKAELRGSSNLISAYKTQIVNGILRLSYDHVNVVDDDLEVYITSPDMKVASISGSGKILISGNFPLQSSLNVRISGSGDVEVNDRFEVSDLYVSVSGSGKAELLKVESKTSDLNISGSGDIRTHTTETLRAKISGSGKVFYSGNPTVSSEISGSGRVIRL